MNPTARKSSGIPWIGDIPEHWEVRMIKTLSPVMRGASPRPIDDLKYFDDNGEYSWVRISDVTASNGSLFFTRDRLSKLGTSLSVKLNPESLFLSIAGSVGKPCISKIKACIHDGFVYFPYLKPESQKYLYWIFTSGDCFLGLGKLGTQLNLNTSSVGSIHIPLPPLAEQQAIAAYLDRETARIDALIEKKQRLVALLDEKRAATISRTVTQGLDPNANRKPSGIPWIGDIPEHWEVRKLKHLGKLKSGSSITFENIFESGNYPVYGGNGLRGYTEAYTHNGHYILIGRQGALCGNINYANGKFWASEHAVVVSPYLSPFNVIWLGELLRFMNLNQYSVSAAQPGISVERILSLPVPYPPLAEQQAIAAYLDRETARIDVLRTKVLASIEKLREYRSALITAAVTGQVAVSGA